MRNCPVGFGFRVYSPYRHGRDGGTPKPGKEKQKRYDYACAVLVIHRFPFSLLFARVVRKVRLEVTPKDAECVKSVRELNREARPCGQFQRAVSLCCIASYGRLPPLQICDAVRYALPRQSPCPATGKTSRAINCCGPGVTSDSVLRSKKRGSA
jgi:hypothetical protein